MKRWLSSSGAPEGGDGPGLAELCDDLGSPRPLPADSEPSRHRVSSDSVRSFQRESFGDALRAWGRSERHFAQRSTQWLMATECE